MRRDVFTADPPPGDYILNPSGPTWGVRRANGNGSVMSISTGEPSRKIALAAVLSLAEGDKADAWETAGTGSFWLIKRYRSAP